MTLFWHPDLLWFRDAPDVGTAACRCSWCGGPIRAAAECVRLFYQEQELRLHAACLAWLAAEEFLVAPDRDTWWRRAVWH
jgi:hypothetical protein